MIVSNKLSERIRFMLRILPFIFLDSILFNMKIKNKPFCDDRLYFLLV